MTSPSLVETLCTDLERYYFYSGREGRIPRRREVWKNFVIPRCAPVALYRLSRVAHLSGWGRLAKVITWWNFYLHGVEIAASCDIGTHFYMPHVSGTVIGAMSIGHHAVIYQQVTIGAKAVTHKHEGRPVIGDSVFIASGARVIGAVELGEGCVVGANAVVTKSAPAKSLLIGIPAKAKPIR